jgi:hypothetical protein
LLGDLDKTLQEFLLEQLRPQFSEIQVYFDPPDMDFAKSHTGINLFLYDVRENRELRTNEWQIERRKNNTVVKRRPPVRVDCSYLITAWAGNDAEGEHALLGAVMSVLVRFPTLPPSVLAGSLRGQEPALPAATLQPGRLQSLGEFWQAMGGKPKATLHYTVTIGVEAGEPVALGVPVGDKQIPAGS